MAEEIIEAALSHRNEINVESVRANDARIVAEGSLVVIVLASVEETASAAPGFAGPIMALSIDLFRAKPPFGTSPNLSTAMPKALMVPSDTEVFKHQLKEKLWSLLRLRVIGNIRLFDKRN